MEIDAIASLSQKKDILIIGGGPAGGSLACVLAKFGFKVAVVDKVDGQKTVFTISDGRTYAISYGSSNMFKTIGLWALIESYIQPILDISISDHQSPWFVDYDHREAGNNPLGFIIESHKLRKAIYDYAQTCKNIDWYAGRQVQELQRTSDHVKAILDNGHEIKAALCVAADGRHSQVREFAGIKTTTWSYPQTALVFQINHSLPHYGRAYENFFPNGPLAILPMQGERASVVWTDKKEITTTLLHLPEKQFNQELQNRFGNGLGDLCLIGNPQAYPLEVLISHSYIDNRLALVGDAAHVIHPVAGQGLNMGLRDVAALAEVIFKARALGIDPGSATILEEYQRWRRFDNITLMAITDGLIRLFSNKSKTLKLFRGIGLGVVQNFPLAKKFFMKHAMGITGELPCLIAGKSL